MGAEIVDAVAVVSAIPIRPGTANALLIDVKSTFNNVSCGDLVDRMIQLEMANDLARGQRAS